MELSVDYLELFPHQFDRTAILVWEVSGTDETTTYVVQRSEYPDRRFITIGVVNGATDFTDEKFVIREIEDQFWYRIVIQHAGQRLDSPAISWDTNPARRQYNAAAAILRQEWRMLQMYPKVTTYRKILSGERCSKCQHDRLPDTENRGASLCTVCFGTGFEGGYHVAAKTHALIPGNQQQKIITPAGRSNVYKSIARLSPYPSLRQGDLLHVPYSQNRFVVDQVQVYRYAGKIPVASELQMSLLPATDIRNKVS